MVQRMTIDAKKELVEIRKKRKTNRRRKLWHKSVLDEYDTDIRELKKAGASLTEIRIFLKSKRVSVVNSTIHRWLQKHG